MYTLIYNLCTYLFFFFLIYGIGLCRVVGSLGCFPHFSDTRESPWGLVVESPCLLYRRSGHFPQFWVYAFAFFWSWSPVVSWFKGKPTRKLIPFVWGEHTPWCTCFLQKWGAHGRRDHIIPRGEDRGNKNWQAWGHMARERLLTTGHDLWAVWQAFGGIDLGLYGCILADNDISLGGSDTVDEQNPAPVV